MRLSRSLFTFERDKRALVQGDLLSADASSQTRRSAPGVDPGPLQTDMTDFNMWTPITAEELEILVTSALRDCTPGQAEAFARYRVPFYPVPIRRDTELETVFVVAHLPGGLLYFEDIEDCFVVSPLAPDGSIAEPGYSQFELRHVLALAGF